MITQIKEMRDNKIAALEKCFEHLDVVVNTAGMWYQEIGIQMDPEQGIFIVNMADGYTLLMGIPAAVEAVSVIVTENSNKVAELTVLPTGECEEKYRKFADGSIKDRVVGLFNAMSLNIENMNNTENVSEDETVSDEVLPPVDTASDGTEVDVVEDGE